MSSPTICPPPIYTNGRYDDGWYTLEHLRQAQHMLKGLSYFNTATELQAAAGEYDDQAGVEFWRRCFIALCDLWDEELFPGLEDDIAAWHFSCSLGFYASGFRDYTAAEMAAFDEAACRDIEEYEKRNTVLAF